MDSNGRENNAKTLIPHSDSPKKSCQRSRLYTRAIKPFHKRVLLLSHPSPPSWGVLVAADHRLGPCCSGASSIRKVSVLLEQTNAPFAFKNHHVSSLRMAEEICIKYTLTGPLGITLKTGTSPQHLLAIKGTWRVWFFTRRGEVFLDARKWVEDTGSP